MKKILIGMVATLVIVFALLYVSPYQYILHAVSKVYFTGHTTAFLEDYRYFENRTLIPAQEPQPWPHHKAYNQNKVPESLESLHQKTGTVAFLIFKNDSLYFEKYYEDYGTTSKSNLFSVSKSIVSALLGKALSEGKIKSLDEPVKTFIPELQGAYADQVTVGNLVNMASGLQWDENYYSPFTVSTEAYFTETLRDLLLEQPINEIPGQEFNYKSGTYQLLGILLERATGMPLTSYLQEVFWEPMGFEQEAFWQIDSEHSGMEKTFCCLATNARDLARFGKLYKNFGNWNGTQIIDSAYVSRAFVAPFEETPMYSHGWWLYDFEGYKTFSANGHLGQYLVVIPKKNLLVVRLGKSTEDPMLPGEPFVEDLDLYLDAALKMTKHVENY